MDNTLVHYDIALLICWYGTYPWYFPYFLHSCKHNVTIDFIIITDNKSAIPHKPENVKIIHKTMDEVTEIASDKFGFKVNIDHPYKLCDYKPAYGFLFPDIIKGYDFWGQSDLDVIYGNIREFITPEMLENYDFINSRHDYTTGCFMLFRNNEKMNTLFMRSVDYKRVFSDPQHYCFDECNFAWDELQAGKSIFEIKTEIESFTQVVKTADRAKEIRAHFDFIIMEGYTGRVVVDSGKIIYKNEYEALLFHLFWLKKFYFPKKVPKKIPDKFYISPTRIYHSRKSKKTSEREKPIS